MAHPLKITSCGSIGGVPACLKFLSRKSFTRDSKPFYAWQRIILCSFRERRTRFLKNCRKIWI
uniref:Uncharacterized protein n=1 Tax=Arundo donax TaxID=35708 RepID=A0A0A9D974_ARUDO